MTYSLYKGVIKPIRDSDRQTGDLLSRYMEGPQARHVTQRSEIDGLLDQIDPTKTRSDLLSHLASIVGFTPELRRITDRLTEAQLRKLIALAVPMWNERHTVRGIINAIRLLTGRPAFVSTWFTYRAVLGEVSLTEDQLTTGGDFWVIGGATSTYDEMWSNIRVMDDGTLDELLLLDICKLMRPIGERFEVFLDDFLDRFEGELDKWTATDGGGIDIVDNGMRILDGTLAEPVIPILVGAANQDYNIVTKFYLDSPGSVFETRFYGVGNDRYQVTINSAGPNKLKLSRYVGGVETVLYNGTPPAVSIVSEEWYKLRISVLTNGTERKIRVNIDNNIVIPSSGSGYEIDAPGSGVNDDGAYAFKAVDGNVVLDNVESWRNPSRFAIITIGTPSEPGGAVTMTDNFVS